MTQYNDFIQETQQQLHALFRDTDTTCVLLSEFEMRKQFTEEYNTAKKQDDFDMMKDCMHTLERIQKTTANLLPEIFETIAEKDFDFTVLQGVHLRSSVPLDEKSILIWVQNNRKEELIDFCLGLEKSHNRHIVFINTYDDEKQENRRCSTDGSFSFSPRLSVRREQNTLSENATNDGFRIYQVHKFVSCELYSIQYINRDILPFTKYGIPFNKA